MTSVDASAATATALAEDEVPQCPLCLEDLDATDLSVRACQCGYPVRVVYGLWRGRRAFLFSLGCVHRSGCGGALGTMLAGRLREGSA